MRVQVVEGPVKENVTLFLKIWRRANKPQAKTQNLFKAWVNRDSGQLLVSEATQEASRLAQREWKPVEICCVYDPDEGEICFWVEEPGSAKGSFQCDDLTPVAFSIMRDTLKTLNDISKRLKGPSNLNTKIAVIAKLELAPIESHKDKNMLIECWHPTDRFHAEGMLWDKPVGTYLFRKDGYAKILEVQLQQEHGKPVKCFTITFSQPGSKFSDLTLVHMEGVWLIYNDDPSLEQTRFPEMLELLNSLKEVIKYPLYHH